MNIENLKKDSIDALKEDFLNSLSDGFIDDYEQWKERMCCINDIIKEALSVDDTNKENLYEYNEFCKEILIIAKECIDKKIDYEKLFLNEKDFLKITKESKKSGKNTEELIKKELQKKFFENFTVLINKDCVVGAINKKIKNHSEIENLYNELEKLFDFSSGNAFFS